MTSTASLSDRRSAPSPVRPTHLRPVPARAHLGFDDVAAWLDDVEPVIRAFGGAATPPSPGRREWLAHQAAHGAHALACLEWEADQAEALGRPVDADEATWLHIRVCVVVEAALAALDLPLAA